MNGAYHYEMAELLVERVEKGDYLDAHIPEAIGQAQVHATLAQAAAAAALLTVNPAYADYAQTVAWSQALKSS